MFSCLDSNQNYYVQSVAAYRLAYWRILFSYGGDRDIPCNVKILCVSLRRWLLTSFHQTRVTLATTQPPIGSAFPRVKKQCSEGRLRTYKVSCFKDRRVYQFPHLRICTPCRTRTRTHVVRTDLLIHLSLWGYINCSNILSRVT